jgi:hypothetical protein
MEDDKLLVTRRQSHRWWILGSIEMGKIIMKENGKKISVLDAAAFAICLLMGR